MSNDEYIADIGDSGVFHSKSIPWSTISTTSVEPLAEILHDTGSSISKALEDNPNATLGTRMHVGYQAYLSGWDGSDGSYNYGAWESFVRFNGLTIAAGKVLVFSRVDVCMVTGESVQDYPDFGTVYYGGKPYRQGGTLKSSLLMTRYTTGEGPTGSFTAADWFDSTGIGDATARAMQWQASDFASGAYPTVWIPMARDSMNADVLSQANTANGLQYGFCTDQTNYTMIGTSRVAPWYYITLIQASDPYHGSPPAYGPRLVLGVVDNHPLLRVLGASIQLSDGSSVYLQWSGSTLQLMRKTGPAATPTAIVTVDTGATAFQFKTSVNSQQCFDICRDSSDNIYLMGPINNANGNQWGLQAYKKSGSTWGTSGTTLVYSGSVTMDRYYYSPITNVSIDWVLPTGSGGAHSGGFIAFNSLHGYGDAGSYSSQRGQNSWGTVDCLYLLNSTGTSNLQYNNWDPSSTDNKLWARNGSGTGMDLVNIGGSYCLVSGYETQTNPGTRDRNVANLWSFSNDGNTGAVSDLGQLGSNAKQTGYVTHDPGSKLRVLHMGSYDWYATCQGGKIEVRRFTNFGTIQASIDLTTQGITSFPSRATLNSSCNWDLFFDRVSQTFWFYFVDSSNPRRVLRIGWHYADNTLVNASAPVQMATNLGPSGSKVISLRLPRKAVDERWVHIDVGIQGADQSLTLMNIEETAFNVAPNKPVINNITSFNATTAGPVSWTFSDSNPADTQAKYDIQVRRVSDSVVVYNPATITGPVVANGATSNVTIPAATLTNNTSYQVRVRTYDFYGAISAWSDWKNFATTSNGLTVTITSPSVDDAPLTSSSIPVSWTFSSTGGTTQVSYRIKVYRTSDNVQLQDSGVVTSTATTATVSSLVSDVEQRIEVVVTDTASNSSAPGIRLVLPTYARPQAPIITVTPLDGFMRVQITNPVPGTDQPQVIRNDVFRRETGDTDWQRIGQTPPNGTYDDYAAAAFQAYDYKVQGVA